MKADPRYGWLKDARVITLTVASAVAGFLIAGLIFGKPWHLPPNWGDIPTWLATIAATTAGIVAYRVYRIEAQRDRISEWERRSAQAAKVATWYGSRQRQVTQRRGDSVQTYTLAEPVWGAFLRNASDLPVSDLVINFYFPGKNDSTETWNIHTINKLTLPPNDAPIHLEIDETALRLYSDERKMDAFHRVEIEFTDSQGIRWHRDVKGRLKGIKDWGGV